MSDYADMVIFAEPNTGNNGQPSRAPTEHLVPWPRLVDRWTLRN
jgi:hypothetical protein